MTPSPRRTPGANSSRKVLQLLLAFSGGRPEASVAELAASIGCPVATTYRYVALLKELDLLEEGRAGRYHLTAQVLPLARAARLTNELTRIARPVMEEAVRELRETVLLFQHFGDSAVCAERVECDRPVRVTFELGRAIPLGSGVSGTMMLALLPETEQPKPQREELKRAKANQYVASSRDGAWACAVPVHTEGHRATVLSMAGPASRMDDGAKRAAIDALHAYAARILARTRC
jgi:DNA-binding IclR family transcriptional regulator